MWQQVQGMNFLLCEVKAQEKVHVQVVVVVVVAVAVAAVVEETTRVREALEPTAEREREWVKRSS
jgi:hypothetical protein